MNASWDLLDAREQPCGAFVFGRGLLFCAWQDRGASRRSPRRQREIAITGIVVDPAGGVLTGATVAVRNMATSVETVAVTNGAGCVRRSGARRRQIHRHGVLEGFRTSAVTDLELLAATTGR